MGCVLSPRFRNVDLSQCCTDLASRKSRLAAARPVSTAACLGSPDETRVVNHSLNAWVRDASRGLRCGCRTGAGHRLTPRPESCTVPVLQPCCGHTGLHTGLACVLYDLMWEVRRLFNIILALLGPALHVATYTG